MTHALDGVVVQLLVWCPYLFYVAGISPTTVLKAKSNEDETQRRTVRKLAKALGVEPRDLLED